ncbi:hypothetical protein PENSPDRAFT_668831 [Peniophora sp. CONT]|nr:hypothetical protein PENSPDRAFT_668831 [Peniophora sp. CONT]
MRCRDSTGISEYPKGSPRRARAADWDHRVAERFISSQVASCTIQGSSSVARPFIAYEQWGDRPRLELWAWKALRIRMSRVRNLEDFARISLYRHHAAQREPKFMTRGFNQREHNAVILALYIPTDGDARVTRVPVTHFSVNQGLTVPKWTRFMDGAVTTRTIHTENNTYLVFTPTNISGYDISEALYEETGIRRRGPILVFQRSKRNRLLVGLRPYDDEAKQEIYEKLGSLFGTLDD